MDAYQFARVRIDSLPRENSRTTGSRFPCRPVTLGGLIKRLDRGGDILRDTESLVTLLEQVLPTARELRAHVHFDQRSYRRNLVCRRSGFEVLVLCWLPGQHSPIHDHHGSLCGVAILAGTATEIRFRRNPGGRLEAASTQVLHAGAVTAADDDELHVLANWTSPERGLVTLHVYTPPLTGMRVYSDALVDPVSLPSINRLAPAGLKEGRNAPHG